MLERELEFRLFSKIEVNKLTGCWIWTGAAKKDNGYGAIGLGDKVLYTHRVSYEIFHKRIDDENVIDHMCRNRICCNPDHLREVSQDINNTENSSSTSALNKRKTSCKRGHPYTPETIGYTKYKDGRIQRFCIPCRHITNKARKKEMRYL